MAESCGTWVRKGLSVFFEYDTPKVVHIRSKKVGVTSRLVQGCILAYIVGYAIIYEKGYQQFDSVMSAVTTKVKGIAYTNFTDEELVGVPQVCGACGAPSGHSTTADMSNWCNVPPGTHQNPVDLLGLPLSLVLLWYRPPSRTALWTLQLPLITLHLPSAALQRPLVPFQQPLPPFPPT